MDPMVIATIIVVLLLVIGLGWWAYSGCKLNAHLPLAYQKKTCPPPVAAETFAITSRPVVAAPAAPAAPAPHCGGNWVRDTAGNLICVKRAHPPMYVDPEGYSPGF